MRLNWNSLAEDLSELIEKQIKLDDESDEELGLSNYYSLSC